MVQRRRFIDRHVEQATLVDAWESGRPELVLLHGRRRVGKSALLSRFAEGRRVAYYVAAQQLKAAQLHDLGEVLAPMSTGFPPGRSPRVALRDWDELLGVLTEQARRSRVGLVLDEFPYLMDADGSLPSLIQRWWDREGSRADLVLVLSGSHQAMMRGLLEPDGALHGRPTRRMEIRPLDYYHAGRFVARWSPEDRVRAYAVAGGMPAYLERFDDQHPFRSELLRLAFAPDGRLFSEAPELLSREFSEPRTYESVLRAIAAGYVTPNEIALQAGLAAANRAAPYLDRLVQLGLVVRRRLPSDAQAVRPRVSRYVLADPYLRFYFGLVDPWRSAIQQGRGGSVLDYLWPERFDAFVSRTFEDVALQYLLRLSGIGVLPPVSSAGPWWFPKGGDIDAVTMTGRAMTAAAEAKWTTAYFKPADLAELRASVAREAPRDGPRLFGFSRSGFDRHLESADDFTPITMRDLYRADLEYERPTRARPSSPTRTRSD